MIAAEPNIVIPQVLVADVADDVDDDNTSSCSHSDEGEVGQSGISHSDSEPNQEKDSGIDCNPDFYPPDEDTATKIRQTVEYYLSDANILKDSFLLKHVRRSKEGFVSLKLISSFRKLRSLCRNWKSLAHSLQNSEVLVLNSDGTKVRRVDSLPDYDETTPSRTVLVYGIQESKISVNSINEMFSKCGEIALVRIQRSGSSIPVDLKRFVLKNPEIQNMDYGLLEFEEYSGAKRAAALVQDQQTGFRVIPLMNHEKSTPQSPVKVQTPKKESPKKKKKRSLTSSKLSLAVEDSESDFAFKKDHRRCSSGSNNCWSSGSYSSSGYLSSSPGRDSYYNRRHSYNPSGSYSEFSPGSFSRDKQRSSKERLNKNTDTVTSSSDLTLSPWRRRREQMMRTESTPTSYSSSFSTHSNSVPVVVVRSPRGPDGSAGFNNRPSRARLPSTAE